MAKKASKVIDGNKLSIKFEETGDAIETTLEEYSPDIRDRLALHGLSQKLGDSYAGITDSKEAFEKVQAVLGDLLKGEWTSRVAAGPRITQLVTALAAVTGEPIEKCQEVVENMGDKEKKDLRAHPHVKAKLAELKAAAAAEAAAKAAQESANAAPLSLG